MYLMILKLTGMICLKTGQGKVTICFASRLTYMYTSTVHVGLGIFLKLSISMFLTGNLILEY